MVGLSIQQQEIAERIAGDDPLLWAGLLVIGGLVAAVTWLAKGWISSLKEDRADRDKIITSTTEVLSSLRHVIEDIPSSTDTKIREDGDKTRTKIDAAIGLIQSIKNSKD